jgi:tetratricopeptide (TPR) repeat protein
MPPRSMGPVRISNCFATFLPTVVLSASLAFANAAARQVSAPDHSHRGIALAKEGKLPAAEQELRAAVLAAPQVATYRAQLGSILGLRGKWQEALLAFQKAVDLAPEDINFRRETAAVQWQLGLMPQAEKNLQLVLANHPDDPGSILLLGMVKEKTGEYASAVELLSSQFESVIAQPDRTVALFHSIVQSGQQAKLPRVVEVLKLHAGDKQWSNAIGRCAQIAALGGDLPAANALFALVPAGDAARPAAGLQLAKALYQLGQISEARKLLSELQSTGPPNPDSQMLLGNCFEAERRPDLALEAYQRALQLDPSRVEHYEDPIALLLYLHKTGDADLLAKHVLSIVPNDARAWVWKGNVDLARNAYRDAMESYRHAVKLDSSNADAAFGVAAAYFVTGQSDAAIAQYKRGIIRFPNDARFYVGCAEMLLASPDPHTLQAQADRLLQKAVQLAPQSAQAHYLLGQLAMQQRRWLDAERELSLSLKSDPDRSKTHFALSTVYRRMGRTDDATKEFALFQRLKQVEDGAATSPMSAVEKP